MNKCFLSDNSAGVCPEIMDAIAAANRDTAPGYGADNVTQSLNHRFSEVFERDVEVFLVGTGTAANALALSVLCPPWGAIFCHKDAHIAVDECGAPEFFTGGAKLSLLPGQHGKLDLEGLDRSHAEFRIGDQHQMQPAAISLSQVTEMGAAYSEDEISAIAGWARKRNMKLHMDGARFANAVASANRRAAAMTWRTGVDIMSFGATKNGALAAEAIVVFDKELAAKLRFLRKRGGQLFSKSRFLAAQFGAYFTDDLWLRNAAHANKMARRLADGLIRSADIELVTPIEANLVFVQLPDEIAHALRKAGFQFLDWPAAGEDARRFVTSSFTTETDIDAILEAANSIKA